MPLPQLDHPDRYAGLYVVDFGPTCGVGYTAEEVAWLLESDRHASAAVYRIVRAAADGTMELKGVPRERFQLESGVLFYRRDLPSARADYAALRRLGREAPPPCRAQLFLGVMDGGARLPFVAGLAFPAEYDEDIGGWLLAHAVAAGEFADGGAGRLDTIRRQARVIDSAQLVAAAGRRTRTRDEVFAAVGQAIQRTA